MAAVQLSLDIPEQQVCLDFPLDENYTWHGRVLMIMGEPGYWVVMTPDLELEYVQITAHRVVPVGRGAALPNRVLGDVYYFDQVDAPTMDRMRGEARALATAVGVTTLPAALPGAAAARWIFSDPAHEKFGQEVDPRMPLDEGKFLARGAYGLVDAGLGAQDWLPVELVRLEDDAQWRHEKQTGPGRDFRVLPILRDQAGRRRARLSDTLQRSVAHSSKDWVFRGPSALEELATAIDATGMDLSTYFTHWKGVSGVAPSLGICVEMRNLLEALRLAFTYDQLDVMNIAAFELLGRRVLQIQRAVRANAKHPSFDGLEGMLSFALDEQGGVVTSKFDEFYSGEQRSNALIMKQQRLMREERAAEAKRTFEGGGKKGDAKGKQQQGPGRGKGAPEPE